MANGKEQGVESSRQRAASSRQQGAESSKQWAGSRRQRAGSRRLSLRLIRLWRKQAVEKTVLSVQS